jgi:NAD(P) transhydrogenase subunit alpha
VTALAQNLAPNVAAEQAAAAAAAAREAADAAARYADMAARASESGLEAAGAAAGIDPFIFRVAIFVLAIFVGYYVVWSVTPALHTPLMSVTNAISSVIVVGALLALGADALMAVQTEAVVPINPGNAALVVTTPPTLVEGPGTGLAKTFGFIALVLASVNIFGGFLVTERMLAMYRRKERPAAR